MNEYYLNESCCENCIFLLFTDSLMLCKLKEEIGT